MNETMKIIECPRDAMQGLSEFIPTETKINYINKLLKVGFEAIDFGSFVSPKAIPQLRDTEEVLRNLNLSGTTTKLLAIVGNKRGGEQAVSYAEISYLGFPFSASETFLQLNINSTYNSAFQTFIQLSELCKRNNKKLVVYLSMAFGNPYKEAWSIEKLTKIISDLEQNGAEIISMSDTVGFADVAQIQEVFSVLMPAFPKIRFGLHLHAKPENAYKKIDAAWKQGVRYFDGVLNGLGGCPMSEYKLVGNLKTGILYDYAIQNGIDCGINEPLLREVQKLSLEVFAGKTFKTT